MTIDYNQIFTLLGIMLGSGGIGTFVGRLSRNERKRDKADADSKVQQAESLMIQNYEKRIEDLHGNISRQNEAEKGYIERISQQNHALTDKTEQIRSLTQKLWESGQGLNRANERITALTEERDNYCNWHCRKGDCPHREPPNPGILHQQFHA